MKAEIITPQVKKEFTPITVQITCETIQEARALFHVVNHRRLHKLMNSAWYDGAPVKANNYSDDVASLHENNNLNGIIREKIERQGLEV